MKVLVLLKFHLLKKTKLFHEDALIAESFSKFFETTVNNLSLKEQIFQRKRFNKVFRSCWYCYEKHENYPNVLKIEKLVERKGELKFFRYSIYWKKN